MPVLADLTAPWDNASPVSADPANAEVRAFLSALALGHQEVGGRAESLFAHLRKYSKQDIVLKHLEEMEVLAAEGGPVGARLLAAFLTVSTAGDRLLPRVQKFTSSRRLHAGFLAQGENAGNFHQDWLNRLKRLTNRCESILPVERGGAGPWESLRDCLDLLLARLKLGDDFSHQDRELLVEMLRLEVDAWQERISHLAGTIDPFRITAVQRVLPVLNRADAEVRDLRLMISMIESGSSDHDFERPESRAMDILDDGDRELLRHDLKRMAGPGILQGLFAALGAHPIPVPDLAHGVVSLQGLARMVAVEPCGATVPDLLGAVVALQKHHDKSCFLLPLDPDFRAFLAEWLPAHADDVPAGITLVDDRLRIAVPEGGAFWEHDFPVGQDALDTLDPEVETKPTATADSGDIDPRSATASELKQLVLGNLMSVSVLLGLLRNPKVSAVPGLVEDVVTRTRNPVVITTVAKVRILHTGFANRGVPLACLRSPMNIPVATLRRFIHVKFISKTDLKRLAVDTTGIRKEVGREVKKYLASLA